MSQDDDYDVGYRKPPKASRWRKGQSGNRHGRVKVTLNFRTELTAELGQIIHIKERGVARRITKQRALVKAIIAKAVQGDTRAATLLINLMFRLLRPELIEGIPPELTKEDQAILDTFEVRRRKDDGESGQ
jgi:uncharacterized protein DUF5681